MADDDDAQLEAAGLSIATDEAVRAECIRVARRLRDSGVFTLAGVQAYSGRIQHIEAYDERRATYLAQIKRLDAGSWFDRKFTGERVPTFDEAVALIRGKAGLFPELKTPEIYEGRKVDFEALVAAALDKHGLRGPKADPKTPVILQTFGQASVRELARIKIGVPVVLLLGSDEGFKTAADVKAWKGIVQGLGPTKNIVRNNPDFVKWAHAEGMSVTPWTFRSSDTAKAGFKDVADEMAQYLYTFGVDALFTDNPDRFPRK